MLKIYNRPIIRQYNPDLIKENNTALPDKSRIIQDKMSFRGDYKCRFFITNFPGLPCAYCARRMYTEDEIDQFGARVLEHKGEEAADIISEYTRETQGLERIVADLIIKQLKSNPEKKAEDVILNLVDSQSNEYMSKYSDLLMRIQEKARKLTEKDCQKVKKWIPLIDYEERKEFLPKSFFSRTKHHKLRLCSTTSNSIILSNVAHLMSQLPRVEEDCQAFIVVNGNLSPHKLLYQLLKRQQATGDHVFLHKDVRGAASRNLICCCDRCNKERHDTEFQKWMTPQRLRNLAMQIEQIRLLPNRRYMSDGYKHGIELYLSRILQTIQDALKGNPYKKPEKSKQWKPEQNKQ